MKEVSPAKRSRIIREAHAQRSWTGFVLGYRVEVQIGAKDVTWRVCVARHWQEGTQSDVWHALDAIVSAISAGQAPLLGGGRD